MTSSGTTGQIKRIFLSWDRPVAERVAEYLIPHDNGAPADLGDRLIIVPTRQAGRRLKQALIERAPIMSPRIEPPTALLRNPPGMHNIATSFDILGAWCKVLQHIDLEAFPALFPKAPPRQDIAWALPTAKALQALRATLAESGERISGIDARALPERERWDDLKRLETLYISQLRDIEKYDPHAQLIKQSHEPVVPDHCREIILAACPDINPIALRALENLSTAVPVTVLIHAPEELADHFGPLGRPLSEAWKHFPIEFPCHGKSLFLEAAPQDQANRVLQVMQEELSELAPGQVALGVPDESIVPALSRRLEAEGIEPYNPGGRDLVQHRYTQLLLNIMRLRTEGSFESLSQLLRHPDILQFIQASGNGDSEPTAILRQLDTYQRNHLPREAIRGILELGLDALAPWLALTIDELLPTLQAVLGDRRLDPDEPADAEALAVIEPLRKAVQEAVDGKVHGLKEEYRFRLLEDTLHSLTYYPHRTQHLIDLEGWLELPWNPAPLLILTGMNEGLVPESRVGDAFLPEAARQALALRSDEDRYARDAYLLAAMQASRLNDGRLVCIVGKTNELGDVLRPSRLLFHCSDEALVSRAEALFVSPKSSEEPAPFAQSIQFTPEAGLTINHLSVTAFRDYLACPFRFYLQRALRMKKDDFTKREMDALDFGTGVHHALDIMGKDPKLRTLQDPAKLASILQECATGWLQQQFGRDLALHLQIQQDAMNRRLAAVAQEQVKELQKGWRILDTEVSLETTIRGMTVKGTADRIDRNEQSGEIRVLDYKTSDSAKSPEGAHLKGKSKTWIDLQLPLYAYMHDPAASVGYFQIPKATSHTGVALWEEFSEEQLKGAVTTAEAIVDNIQQGVFWPPTEKVDYDDFQELFYSGIEQGLTAKALSAFQEGQAPA